MPASWAATRLTTPRWTSPPGPGLQFAQAEEGEEGTVEYVAAKIAWAFL